MDPVIINPVATYEREGRVAVLTIDSPPVNALSAAVRQGLAAGAERAMADPEADALVLLCGGRTFFAGADITEFGKPMAEPNLRVLLDQLEAASKPVIAALHGTALGGGLELALVAHHRIAVPSAKAGLPEVKLGLIPGAGGTQRLPRLIGVEAALVLMTDGQPVTAAEALEIGLVDALAEEGRLRRDAVAFAGRVLAEARPLVRARDQDESLLAARADPAVFASFRSAMAAKFRGFHAPEAIIQAVEAAVNLPFDQGMDRERDLFREALADSQSAALRHVFFAERKAGKLEGEAAKAEPRPVAVVGVVGAGTMGGGIAMSLANAGVAVRIVEASQDRLDAGLSVVRRNYEASARRGRLTAADVQARMDRLSGSTRCEDLADCDLIIEAVFESMEVKLEVFRTLDAVAKPDAILASNTSLLDIDAIAAATARPQDVLGLHFFSPAHVMRLLEIVRGGRTSDAALATATRLTRTLGKVGVIAGNGPGFIGNRMLAARQREAEALVLEGATPWRVDQVLYAFGFPMGPFQMNDLAGLDVGWNAQTSTSSTVRQILNEQGRKGQKSAAGYYDYDAQRNGSPSAVVEALIRDFAAARGVVQREVSDEEILERCLYPMINEGAKVLEEAIAARASDIDVVWVSGYGWPSYRGGPMFWADLTGLPRILERLNALRAPDGEAFRPAALLEDLVAKGQGFASLN
jgi:3-hydroxyacyl-CoA dehydrogenase